MMSAAQLRDLPRQLVETPPYISLTAFPIALGLLGAVAHPVRG